MEKPIALILSLSAMAGFVMSLYGVACLLACLRHRLPDIPWMWVAKTFAARANFTQRGQALHRKAVRFGLGGFILFFVAGIAAQKHQPPAAPPPTATRSF